ncbi:hypothetical protein CXG81DRAFT_23512 [Caulochytrium protostelioides]|uniref:RRM domain-containing protein n=1 Tax=Caulochytrium protostelioides TaxID=1555241 RepID=A0A4P9XE56_9FUNG|nr:hypothetical protein CXG81DRAFT_23512 [Caulochytrium protostelioides]|eukprot:RKP03815.1 hypothetical protein CXG81DRAFT_23512 [Caulochytrium protostelioides]
MHIPDEAVAGLKAYLIPKIEPLSDADPAVMADYIIALVTQASDLNDARISCITNLSDFLHHHTEPFITSLMEVLPQMAFGGAGAAAPAPAAVPVYQPDEAMDDASPTDVTPSAISAPSSVVPAHAKAAAALPASDFYSSSSQGLARGTPHAARDGGRDGGRGGGMRGSMRQGGEPRQGSHHRTVVWVRHLPYDKCNVAELNQYFSQFGTIVNISLLPPECALIHYETNAQAYAALTARPVMDDPNIQVNWHRSPEERGLVPHASAAASPRYAQPVQQQQQQQQPAGGAATMAMGLKEEPAVPETAEEQQERLRRQQQHIQALNRQLAEQVAERTRAKHQTLLDQQKRKSDLIAKQLEDQQQLMQTLSNAAQMDPARRTELMQKLKVLAAATQNEIAQEAALAQTIRNTAASAAVRAKQPYTSDPALLLAQHQQAQLEQAQLTATGADGDALAEQKAALDQTVAALKEKAQSLGIDAQAAMDGAPAWTPPAHWRGSSRGRGRGGGFRGAHGYSPYARGGYHGAAGAPKSLDKRPRAIAVGPVDPADQPSVWNWAKQFGRIESTQMQNDAATGQTRVVLQYSQRWEAEKAAGSSFVAPSGTTLQPQWHVNAPAPSG